MSINANLDALLGFQGLGDPYLASLIGSNIGTTQAAPRAPASPMGSSPGNPPGSAVSSPMMSGLSAGISPSTGVAPSAGSPQVHTSGTPAAVSDLGKAVSAYGAANQVSGNQMPSQVNSAVGDVGNALGVYNGIRQGGVAGDTSAAVNAAKLGANLGAFGSASPAIGQYAGYAAIPLDIYNEVHNWKSGSTGSDALAGAQTGAAIGSVIPGIGTAIGALVGGAAGALSSAFGPGAKDPETYAVQNVIDAVGAHPGQAAQITSSVSDPYLQLAGLFDRRSSTLPMYQQYGRMGELKFTNDMVGKINQAVQDGTISKNSSPTDIYNKVVSPWVNSMGTGYNNVGSAYTATTQGLLQDMVNQYVSGQAPQAWKAVGGDQPFSDLPVFGSAPAQQAPPRRGRTGNVSQLKKGGSVLDRIRPSFVQHFDDGGSVGSYSSYYTPVTSSYTPPDFSTNYTPSDLTPVGTGDITNAANSDYTQASNSINAANSSSGGGLSSLLNLIPGIGSKLAGLSTGQQIGALGGLATLLGSIGGGNNTGGVNMTTNYNPSPPQMFKQPTGPNPYGNFTATPRHQVLQNIDYAHYGAGPAASFFSPSSPSAQSPSPSTSTSPLAGGAPFNLNALLAQLSPQKTTQPINLGQRAVMAHGGSMHGTPLTSGMPHQGHVQGPGDGREDLIPARLSNGEWVADAETVSLLGNGSNDAGARKLDDMRENLRKHKGKVLAKGKFSPNAKQPEKYMGGKV